MKLNTLNTDLTSLSNTDLVAVTGGADQGDAYDQYAAPLKKHLDGIGKGAGQVESGWKNRDFGQWAQGIGRVIVNEGALVRDAVAPAREGLKKIRG
jgi:hypothetical protein